MLSYCLLYCQAHYQSSYSNWPGVQVFLVFTATFLLCSLLNWIKVALKISAGGVGSPYNQLYPVSYQSTCTNYSCTEDTWCEINHLLHSWSDMARYFTVRLYFHSPLASENKLDCSWIISPYHTQYRYVWIILHVDIKENYLS